MTEIINWIHETAQWIVLAVATGIIGFIGKLFYDAWKDIKTTLKHLVESFQKLVLKISNFQNVIESLNKLIAQLFEKIDELNNKLIELEKTIKEQERRIDETEKQIAVLKATCHLHHMKGGEG